jgi:hypothetical protein
MPRPIRRAGMTDGLTTSHRRMPDATCDAGADGVKGRVAPR